MIDTLAEVGSISQVNLFFLTSVIPKVHPAATVAWGFLSIGFDVGVTGVSSARIF